MKKRNDKGFTLVELIVVLVILAILAAILVPALLGYIDKAREKQVTTNAEAAYVAAQALATEYYGKHTTIVIADRNTAVSDTEIKKLTDITTSFTFTVGFQSDDPKEGKKTCIINAFTYTENGYTATWSPTDGSWTVAEASAAGSGSGGN